jgi:hypothetical protein
MRLAALAALLVSAPVWARAQADLPYGVAEAFSTAVRFVRIDRGCKLVDKDADAAFVAFECRDGAHVRHGSMELFKVARGVRAQITLADDTHGMELRWLELFERKLREERGTPAPPAPTPPRSIPDGGTS